MSRQGFIVAGCVLLMLSGLNCRRPESVQLHRGITMPQKTIEQVQQEHTEAWMAIPGVVGTAIGQREGKPCLLVLAAANTEQIRRKIPSTVEGYRVLVQYTGEIHAR